MSYANTGAAVEDTNTKHPNENRQKRIRELNVILNEFREEQRFMDADAGHEDLLLWDAIKPVYDSISEGLVIKQKEIPDDILDSLDANLRANRSVSEVGFGTAHHVMLVLVHLSMLFEHENGNSDMKVEIGEPIPGSNLDIKGQFEFIVQRGRKKLYLIQTNKYLTGNQQGMR